MTQRLYGSINYDALLEAIKSGKAKTFKTDKGVRLININIWVNDEPDQYKNHASIQVQLKDEFIEQGEKAPYIGNLKKAASTVKEATAEDFSNEEEEDDLPF